MPGYKMISAAVALTFASSMVSAAVVSTLSFTTPTGTVGPTDTIDVWVTLTLDPSSDPLTYDGSYADWNLPVSLMPAAGWLASSGAEMKWAPFASYDLVLPTYGFRCIGNLVSASCGDGEYSRSVATGIGTWFGPQLNMQPGESRDFNVLQFTPTNGSATPGEYFLSGLMIGFYALGKDSEGNELRGFTPLGDACRFDDSSCMFTRTVSEVPLPAGIWLFGSALIGLAGARFRRIAGR